MKLTTDNFKQVLESGSYEEKSHALKKILKNRDWGTKYQVCPVCNLVGVQVWRKGRNGKLHSYFYHYSRKDGKKYCSLEEIKRRKDRKKRTVNCPKCKRKGLYSKKAECHTAMDLEHRSRVYEVRRVVIYHGKGDICYINKEHLKKLKKRYSFIRDTKIAPAQKISFGEDEKKPKYKNKRSALSRERKRDIQNKIGMKLEGFEWMEFKIKVLEGQKKAKDLGKKIGFDVERKLLESKMSLYIAKQANNPSLLHSNKKTPTADECKIFNPYGYYRRYKSNKSRR